MGAEGWVEAVPHRPILTFDSDARLANHYILDTETLGDMLSQENG